MNVFYVIIDLDVFSMYFLFGMLCVYRVFFFVVIIEDMVEV